MARPKGNAAGDDGENISGYFRQIFNENPKLLRSRSNAELLQRWLNDHPGYSEVPGRVRNGLMNVKSVLRKRKRGRARRAMEESMQTPGAPPRPARKPVHGLEKLEEQIDECLSAAKQLDREGLEQVIRSLRLARNLVVWQLGQ